MQYVESRILVCVLFVAVLVTLLLLKTFSLLVSLLSISKTSSTNSWFLTFFRSYSFFLFFWFCWKVNKINHQSVIFQSIYLCTPQYITVTDTYMYICIYTCTAVKLHKMYNMVMADYIAIITCFNIILKVLT